MKAALISIAVLSCLASCARKIDESQLPEYLGTYQQEALSLDLDQAEKTMTVVARSFPDDPQYKLELVSLYVLQGNLKKAQEACEKILEDFPGNEEALEWRATLSSPEGR